MNFAWFLHSNHASFVSKILKLCVSECDISNGTKFLVNAICISRWNCPQRTHSHPERSDWILVERAIKWQMTKWWWNDKWQIDQMTKSTLQIYSRACSRTSCIRGLDLLKQLFYLAYHNLLVPVVPDLFMNPFSLKVNGRWQAPFRSANTFVGPFIRNCFDRSGQCGPRLRAWRATLRFEKASRAAKIESMF